MFCISSSTEMYTSHIASWSTLYRPFLKHSHTQHMPLILHLHCHWKPSQNGTVLKIASCWPLTDSVYTAINRMVWVLSIFDLKGGISGSTSHDIIYHGGQFMVSSSVGKRNVQESTKTHGTQLHNRDNYCCHAFLGLKHTSSVLSMAAAWIWLDITYTDRWEGAKLSKFCARTSTTWLSWAWCWHALVMFTLPLLIIPSHAGTMLAQFQVAV